MLVIDASVAVVACLAGEGWDRLRGYELFAPPLLLSETTSALHEAQWRGELTAPTARAAMEQLAVAPITIRALSAVSEAWQVADELGWAKTYDAEYVALARGLSCRLVTLDERLRRGVRGLIDVIGPAEL